MAGIGEEVKAERRRGRKKGKREGGEERRRGREKKERKRNEGE